MLRISEQYVEKIIVIVKVTVFVDSRKELLNVGEYIFRAQYSTGDQIDNHSVTVMDILPLSPCNEISIDVNL